jgi:hypothetical protein
VSHGFQRVWGLTAGFPDPESADIRFVGREVTSSVWRVRSSSPPTTIPVSSTPFSSMATGSPARSSSTSQTRLIPKLGTPPGCSSSDDVQKLVPQGMPMVKAFLHDLRPPPWFTARAAASSSTCSSPATTRRRSRMPRSSSPTAAGRDRCWPAASDASAGAARFLHIALQQPVGLGLGSAIKLHL